MDKPLHLIQPVGFSLPNIVCALAHEGIQTATLLLTEQIPKENAHRAIELANTCRKIALDPFPQIVIIPSPDAETRVQFGALQSIPIPEDHQVVVGLTGGTQRVTCTLLSRYGPDCALWVVDEPRAFLSLYGKTDEGEALNTDISDYEVLYGLDDIPANDYHISDKGRLMFKRNISLSSIKNIDMNKKQRKGWRTDFRTKVQDEISLLNTLEQKFGRINFRFVLNIESPDDETLSFATTIIGRFPTRLSLTVNGKPFTDRIKSMAIDNSLYSGFLRPEIYQLPNLNILRKTETDDSVLHVMCNPHNSVNIANSISNHKPKIVCLWAINHNNDQDEIERLCIQAFTAHGWLEGKLPDYFLQHELHTKKEKRSMTSPVCEYGGPNKVYFINTNVSDVLKHTKYFEGDGLAGIHVMETSSGTGHLSHTLFSALSQYFQNVEMTYTQPWTGEMSNLKSGENTPGQGIPIVDRFWLQQRPVKKTDPTIEVQKGQRNLLQSIAAHSIELHDFSQFGRHSLPIESWGDVFVEIIEPNSIEGLSKKKWPKEIRYSGYGSTLTFSGEADAGGWLEEITMAIIALDDNLDAVFGVEVLTSLEEDNPFYLLAADMEIDGIIMKEDGFQFISCKMGNKAFLPYTVDEALSWRALLGGPNPKPVMIVHSNTMMPFTVSQMDTRDAIHHHWSNLIGLNSPSFSFTPIDLQSAQSLRNFLIHYVEMHTSQFQFDDIVDAHYNPEKNAATYTVNVGRAFNYLKKAAEDIQNWMRDELRDSEIGIRISKASEPEPLHKGTVKWFNQQKGFGFIEQESGGDLYVHISNVQEKIIEGDSVIFNIETHIRGLIAVNVHKISEEEE